MENLELVYWDHSNNIPLLINLAIAIGIFTCLRLFSGVIANVNPTTELFTKDNAAFGISMAGVAFAVTIMLSGVIYGDPVYNKGESTIAVGLYGILGIILMAITRIIFDKVCFPSFSIEEEIVKGNISAGIVDAGNVIATAIIIRAIMVWVDTNSLEGIHAVLIGYLISQILLVIVSLANIKYFEKLGISLQEELRKGNAALALRYIGKRINVAFAITAASHIMVYEIFDIQLLLLVWSGVSLVMIFIVAFLGFVANRIILFQIDTNHEIIKQKNLAVGVLQSIIYISIGLLVSELMA